MSENDRQVPLLICDFLTQNKICGTQLVFQKRRFEGSIPEILRMVSLLGEKFFSTPLGQPKFQQFSNFLCMFMFSF